MTDSKKFRLTVAIDEAFAEFSSLEDEAKTPINVMMIAKKYAPRTINDCLECLGEFRWLFVFEPKPGFTLQDVVVATITNYMSASLMSKWEDDAKANAMREAKNRVLVPGRRRG